VTESLSLPAFEGKAEAWENYTATPLGRLRRELTLRHLAQHLAELPRSLKILDAGGGTGDQAIALAEQGHQICLLDFSSQMLTIAKRKVEQLDPYTLERVGFLHAPAEEICRYFAPGHFDVVLCHTLLEYTPRPWEVLHGLTTVLNRGGMISLLLVNPHADGMRWALRKMDLVKARLALYEDASSADLFGLPRRILPSEAVREAMTQAGIEGVAEYGIRIFADYLPAENLADGEFFAHLVELEMSAGGLDPYRLIGRYVHLLGRKARRAF
jgi:S-adenosylmethionine-dependent methyltransferase